MLIKFIFETSSTCTLLPSTKYKVKPIIWTDAVKQEDTHKTASRVRVSPPNTEAMMQQITTNIQYTLISISLMMAITITFISFMIAQTTMTVLLGNGKHQYIPKRLRRKRMRIFFIFNKIKWKKTERMRQSIKNESASTRRVNPKHLPKVKEIYCFAATKSTKKETAKSRQIFDGDTFKLVIDSGCSYCITNNRNHFVGDIETTNVNVKGIGGQNIKATMKGTVRWSFANDNGQVHDEYISNTYFNEECPYCLYSPQHVAQLANDHHPKPNGTYCITYSDKLELYWDQATQKRTVPINSKLNVFIMTSAPDIQQFHAFASLINKVQQNNETMTSPSIQAMVGNVVSDGESDDESNHGGDGIEMVNPVPIEEQRKHPDLPNGVFDVITKESASKPIEEIHVIPIEDQEVQATTPQAKLLAWHYRLGHISFRKIQQLARRGDLPAALATCQIPKCAACMYGKATRRPWRTKAPINVMLIPPVTAPGSVVSMDQMVSAVPGLIPQMKGFITFKRYEIATVFVDHFSGISFVHLQKGATAVETIEAKHAFERYAKVHGIRIHHYHADNGIFESREFQESVFADGQTISFCGVNAHHQNGRAEKKIRDLQELTRTMILHAQHRWPDAISPHLWPMAIKNANDLTNRAPMLDTGLSPIEIFTQVEVTPKVKHAHTF